MCIRDGLSDVPQICQIAPTAPVPQVHEPPNPKLVVLPTASVFAGAIRQNYYRQSIGELFDFGADDLDDSP